MWILKQPIHVNLGPCKNNLYFTSSGHYERVHTSKGALLVDSVAISVRCISKILPLNRLVVRKGKYRVIDIPRLDQIKRDVLKVDMYYG